VESKPTKAHHWRPLASKPSAAKSFVLLQTVCNRLIFLKWHGRGHRFEPDQVHQFPRLSNKTAHSRMRWRGLPACRVEMNLGSYFTTGRTIIPHLIFWNAVQETL
jgi:hypothetical protein